MKSKKSKSSNKATKKTTQRVAKKQLEATISEKFMEAVKGLGHDAGKIGKEIKKASKQLAEKLSGKIQEIKESVDSKADAKVKKTKVKALKKSVTSPKKIKKDIAKAEKVVAKAVKTVESTELPATKRAYTRRTAENGAVAAKVSNRRRITDSAIAAPKTRAPRKVGATTANKATSTRAARKPRVVKPAPVSEASAGGDINSSADQSPNHKDNNDVN